MSCLCLFVCLCVRLCVLFAAAEQEVTIKDVVLMIADAIGFQGEIEVRAGCDSAPEWQPTPRCTHACSSMSPRATAS